VQANQVAEQIAVPVPTLYHFLLVQRRLTSIAALLQPFAKLVSQAVSIAAGILCITIAQE
jgi:hypothetical protein